MSTVPWLVTALALVLAEVVSFNFVFASFAIGALAAAAAAPAGLGAAAVAFAIGAVASLTLIRPAVLRHLYRRSDGGPTGIDKLIGRSAVATSIVTEDSGTVVLDGETWSARTPHGPIASGESVRITAILGAIARVERF